MASVVVNFGRFLVMSILCISCMFTFTLAFTNVVWLLCRGTSLFTLLLLMKNEAIGEKCGYFASIKRFQPPVVGLSIRQKRVLCLVQATHINSKWYC